MIDLLLDCGVFLPTKGAEGSCVQLSGNVVPKSASFRSNKTQVCRYRN